MTEAEREALLRCGLFAGISPAAVERLLQCIRGDVVHYEKNHVLWPAGQRLTACAVVLSGALRAETVTEDGRHTLVAWQEPGALVGDILMASSKQGSPVYVIAAENTDVFLLPFERVMGGCPNCCPAHALLRENLVREIAAKYWVLHRRLDYLTISSLRGRIMALLQDRAPESGPFSLGMTRENMADFLFVNRSALSRELSRMKQDGLIDCYRDTFQILKEK